MIKRKQTRMDAINQYSIGQRCAEFRKTVMGLTLREFQYLTDENYKTLSAFEHGRSSNLRFIWVYYDQCEEYEKPKFVSYLFGEWFEYGSRKSK
jgi:hypothetical protein